MKLKTAKIENLELGRNYFMTMNVKSERKFFHVMRNQFGYLLIQTDDYGWAASNPTTLAKLPYNLRHITNI
jgi:hypothetical protein